VARLFHPVIRFTRDQCFDLPDTTYQLRRAALSPEQSKAFQSMAKVFMMEYKKGDITAANSAVKVQKLLQICCGAVYNDEQEPVMLDCSPRVKILKDTIEEVGGKILLFVPYVAVIRMLHNELRELWDVATIYGDVPTKMRAETFQRFQSTNSPRIIIAQPNTMAHGLTLTAAKAIIWYAPIYSNEVYIQANGRVERIGKTHPTTVIHMSGTNVEDNVYRKLEKKQSMQDILLDLLEARKLNIEE
jgi:SNF2 family DNA or RNA helicase